VRTWIRDTVLPSQAVAVAVTQDHVVGIVALDERDGTTWITQLYVLPRHVGHGIGSRLLAYAIQRSRGPVRLYCFQQNEGARRFYERHGFKAIAFSDGRTNEERCPDVLYERAR
jgi:GNAT superfamily N-acetyltransferase